MNSISKSRKPIGAGSTGEPREDGYVSSADTVSSTQRKTAGLILELIDAMRDQCNDPELPSQTMAMLLTIASSTEPRGVVEFGDLVGMSKASASRLVQTLGRGMRDKDGLGLVEAYEDPQNWSRKLVKLTPKGVRLMGLLEDKLLRGLQRLS